MLVDTGCSVSLVSGHVAGKLSQRPGSVELEIMSGGTVRAEGVVVLDQVLIGTNSLQVGPVEAYVVPRLPLDLDVIVGLDVILRFGLRIPANNTNYGEIELTPGVDPPVVLPKVTCAAQENVSIDASQSEPTQIRIEDVDFITTFHNKEWTVKWMWKNGPPPQNSRRGNYAVPEKDQEAFGKELEAWISEGILIPWDAERDGEIRNVLPLMSVRQQKGEITKVRPVLDFRVLNQYITSHPGAATPLCQERLREWRRLGANCAVVDLRKAYLQVKIDPSLWSYQVVRWRGTTYVLTKLGFGLNIAPKVMTKIVEHTLQTTEAIGAATSSYIDDIIVDESKVSVIRVIEHLKTYGLKTKPPEHLGNDDGVRVLGLKVDRNYNWTRDSDLPTLNDQPLTRRMVHKLLGEWLGHFPVCGWLRVACGFLQRSTAKEDKGWDEVVSESIRTKVIEIFQRLKSGDDPVRGAWLVPLSGETTIWTDASNLALGVVLTSNGNVIEDAAWLRKPKDTSHINVSELDAAIRGINLALKWKFTEFTIKTDSATVYGWLRSVFHNTHNVKTRALSELLIRRRLQILREIREQERLKVSVQLVRSEHNVADALTRVPRSWVTGENTALIANADGETSLISAVLEIHGRHHLGVDRTWELVKAKLGPAVKRADVRKVLAQCDECARICPSTNPYYTKGTLSSDKVWFKVSSDITHFGGRAYLTLVDLGSRYCVWRLLRRETAEDVCLQLNQVFAELGPPSVLLSDNAAVYKSTKVKCLMRKWDVKQQFSCAYRPQGNGVVERNHRTIKTMAARSGNTVEECSFWYNVTSGVHGIPPYNFIFHSTAKLPGVTAEREFSCSTIQDAIGQWTESSDTRSIQKNPFVIGDSVYLRGDGKCDSEWSGPHRVTKLISDVSLEINGDDVPRHVSHVKRVPRTPEERSEIIVDHNSNSGSESDSSNESDDPQHDYSVDLCADSVHDPELDEPDDASPGSTQPRRSVRSSRRPFYLRDYFCH